MDFTRIRSDWRGLNGNDSQPSKILIGGIVALTLSLSQATIGSARVSSNEAKENRQAQHSQTKTANRAAKADRKENRQETRANKQENRQQNKQENRQAQAFRADTRRDYRAEKSATNQANQQANRNAAAVRQENRADNRADNRAANRAQNRADKNAAAIRQENRADNRAQNRADNRADKQAAAIRRDRANDRRIANRWDSQLDNRDRYKSYKRYRNSWHDQRTYLNSNLARFNQLSQLNQQQQALLDSQMRAAYLSYRHNQYNGPYTWDNYSDPQFLDYLQTSKPTVLQTILSALGLGGDDNYLYSSNWDDERSQLSQNMQNIHQLAVEGRITSAQEQQLMAELRPQFMAYNNNHWNNSSVTWSNYSDPNFVDYLNNKRPSILTTIRDYLIR